MQGQCKDCAHWYRLSKSAKTGTCEEVSTFENEDKEPDENGFALIVDTLDDQGLQYKLQTGPLFGCLAFSPRKG